MTAFVVSFRYCLQIFSLFCIQHVLLKDFCTTSLAVVNNEVINSIYQYFVYGLFEPCIMFCWYVCDYDIYRKYLLFAKNCLCGIHHAPPPPQWPKTTEETQDRLVTRIGFCYVVPPDICPDPRIQNDLSESELSDI